PPAGKPAVAAQARGPGPAVPAPFARSTLAGLLPGPAQSPCLTQGRGVTQIADKRGPCQVLVHGAAAAGGIRLRAPQGLIVVAPADLPAVKRDHAPRGDPVVVGVQVAPAAPAHLLDVREQVVRGSERRQAALPRPWVIDRAAARLALAEVQPV